MKLPVALAGLLSGQQQKTVVALVSCQVQAMLKKSRRKNWSYYTLVWPSYGFAAHTAPSVQLHPIDKPITNGTCELTTGQLYFMSVQCFEMYKVRGQALYTAASSTRQTPNSHISKAVIFCSAERHLTQLPSQSTLAL